MTPDSDNDSTCDDEHQNDDPDNDEMMSDDDGAAEIDALQEHHDNETARSCSHRMLAEGVEHPPTAAEQIQLDADTRHPRERMPEVGASLLPPMQHTGEQAQKHLTDLRDRLNANDPTPTVDTSEIDARMTKEEVQAAISTTLHQHANTSTSQSSRPTITINRNKATKPIDEFTREMKWLARAFPVHFPFGVCSFNNTDRPYAIDDFREYIDHLMKLTYQRPHPDPTKPDIYHNPFQEPTFIQYAHNRIHRHRIMSQFHFYIEHKCTDHRLRSDDFTISDLKAMTNKQIAKLVKNAVVYMRALPGDPGDLRRVANNMRNFTLDYECASDFETTSYNDLHLPDLHRPEILNYRPTENGHNQDTNTCRQQVYDNPATVACYFMMRQLVRRDVLMRYNHPIRFTKWFLSKFEFQGRGTVHEHMLRKVVYLFITKAGMDDKKDHPNEPHQPEHFQRVDLNPPKLAMYSAASKLASIVVQRLAQRANTLAADPTVSEANRKMLRELATIITKSDAHKHTTSKQPSGDDAPPPVVQKDVHDIIADTNQQDNIPNSNTLDQILAYHDTNTPNLLTETLAMLHRDLQLGEEADAALIAYHNALLHSWDNSMERYNKERQNKRWVDQHEHNIAKRFDKALKARLKQPANDRSCIRTFYTKQHKHHQQSSQYHKCRRGYCLRQVVDKKRATKGTTSRTQRRRCLCRLRWPWTSPKCTLCHKLHTTISTTGHFMMFCNECRAKNKTTPFDETTIANAQKLLPFAVHRNGIVKHTVRFDRHNRFKMITPEVGEPRNHGSINSHNNAETLSNNGNSDHGLTLNPGQVAAYTIGYQCKTNVTVASAEETVRQVRKSFNNDTKDDSIPARKFIQRAASAALASQGFCNQSAAWSIMKLPVIDTNLRFRKVNLNDTLRRLNTNFDPTTNTNSNRKLKAYSDKEVYSRRKDPELCTLYTSLRITQERVTNQDEIDAMHNTSLQEFVLRYTHLTKKNNTVQIVRRERQCHDYSRFQACLKFADNRYPLLHIPKFTPYRSNNPNSKLYHEWCMYALMRFKPWVRDEMTLWHDNAGECTTRQQLLDTNPEVFIQCWEEFINNADDPRAVDAKLRLESYLKEQSCGREYREVGAFVDNSWGDDPLYNQPLLATGMYGNIAETSSVNLLPNPTAWKTDRQTARAQFTADQLATGEHFLQRHRREGTTLRHNLPFVNPKTQLDEQQRLVWTLAQLAMNDDLPPNEDGSHRQLLLQVPAPGGYGKSRPAQHPQRPEVRRSRADHDPNRHRSSQPQSRSPNHALSARPARRPATQAHPHRRSKEARRAAHPTRSQTAHHRRVWAGRPTHAVVDQHPAPELPSNPTRQRLWRPPRHLHRRLPPEQARPRPPHV